MTGRAASELTPKFVGRLTRILFGLGAFAWLWFEPVGVAGAALLAVLGVSFLLGGVVANPGCEITAIPNLFLSKEKRLHSL